MGAQVTPSIVASVIGSNRKGPMRILLINPGQEASLFSMTETADITGAASYIANLALPTLAALTPADFAVTLVDENVEPLDPYLPLHWDVVGITGYCTHRERMFALADEFHRRGRLVVIGGPYASLSAKTVRPYADVLFIGEAENTWPEFLADLRAGSWKSEYREAAAVDLDSSPLPAVGKLKPGGYFAGNVQTSRGCPFECDFCDVIVYLGRKQRHKTPERVVQEMERFYEIGYRNIFLADDNLTAFRKKAAAILTAVGKWNRDKSERVALVAQMSIDAARAPDLLDIAAGAGLKQAFIGIETPSVQALREARKRQNLHRDLIADIRAFQQRGIAVQAGIITGFDADTCDSFAALFHFLQRAGTPHVLVNMLSAPEGTPLEARLRSENRLAPAMEAGHMQTNIVPKNMTLDQLQYGTIWLLNKLFSADNFLERVAVLVAQWPTTAFPLGWAPMRYARIWQNLLRAYDKLGPEFRRVPREAVKLCRGKDASMLGGAMAFHVHNVRVLQQQGMWSPTLARLDAPDFESLAALKGDVSGGPAAHGMIPSTG